jgi:hypothetical protein
VAHKVVTTPESPAAAAAAIGSTQKDAPACGAANEIEGSSLKSHPSTAAERHLRIAELAHQKASQRNFEPGAELDDWLAAEREVDAQTSVDNTGGPQQ